MGIKSSKRTDTNTLIGFEISSTMTINDYTFIKVCGNGEYGRIMQVRKNDNDEIYGLKVVKKRNLIQKQPNNIPSRNILSNIKHPFICSLQYAFQNEKKIYLVADFFEAQELFYNLKNECHLSLKRSKFYSAEICVALGHIHSFDIIYGCLKPQNILLTFNGHILITDFDLKTDSLKGNELTHITCLDLMYCAPEIIKKQSIDKAVDWWSFGILLYEMMVGLPPFLAHENNDILCRHILTDQVTFPSDFDENAKILILNVLEKNPNERLGNTKVFNVDEIKNELLNTLEIFHADHMFVVNTIILYLPINSDAQEIQSQQFYDGVDFHKLANKKYKPPFKPKRKAECPCFSGACIDCYNE